MESPLHAETSDELSSFHIHATSSIAERWPHTLKEGDMFALFDRLGDVVDPGLTPGGIFLGDTRHLSGLQLLINGQRPLLLSSTTEEDNVVLTTDLSNPDIYRDGQLALLRETLHLRRSRFLWKSTCYERMAIRNFDGRALKCWLTIRVAADFADLFEIRGMQRPARGKAYLEQRGAGTLLFRYLGLDETWRSTEITFDPVPTSLTNGRAMYELNLPAASHRSVTMAVKCDVHEQLAEPFSIPYRAARRERRKQLQACTQIASRNELAERMFARAQVDLQTLVTETPEGPYPYAGTPWFNTAFGRDGIIAALEVLWLNPGIARGVLKFLAATQATQEDNRLDAQPGKILHETRKGEMAKHNEVPFGRYYGSIDATPLFVMLAARYFERTGDRATLQTIWPHIKAALRWIDEYGDRDGDGFVEYFRESPDGLVNQGWKDSHDAIFHEDGRLAEGPIALCEVQGYVYAAKRGAAQLARKLGDDALAYALDTAADALRAGFEREFWCEDLGVYALALDGGKAPCRVRSSNAGQVLYSGIARHDRAKRIAQTLLLPECFSGWGIRTLSCEAARYNPMSYHNGSVWPHDNALIALGMARYGLKREAAVMFSGLFDAACHMELMRFPELFCGFARRKGAAPTLYPVACMPQAWACVAPFAMLEACLGIKCDHDRGEIRFEKPVLPKFLANISIVNLALGEGAVDLHLQRHDANIAVTTVTRHGDVAVSLMK